MSRMHTPWGRAPVCVSSPNKPTNRPNPKSQTRLRALGTPLLLQVPVAPPQTTTTATTTSAAAQPVAIGSPPITGLECVLLLLVVVPLFCLLFGRVGNA